ncbi:hypothetical protein PENANT_c023G00115 [Penicillium antarcticum]|uniref:Uncharacterized protein n=1 Tax=Penicillium antarcticum TaxID=416450 RepID=A0A1V6Q0C8_9EURO|nr:uncharacterized protein N7508_006159 [Penicillium antarcticum]KAJ5301296.1 hypothetical protein N7508_006159 [Penicillium antarcticum]OQD82156.1 hypothetical protein PENANT_c023G00115 [Penicillium antarcticum]
MMFEPAFHIKLYTSTELLSQPWLSDLTSMVNASYRVSHTSNIKFPTDKTRLLSDSQLSKEIGPDGFTAVALADSGPYQKPEVIGTASLKKWKDDGLWTPFKEHEEEVDPVVAELEDEANQEMDRMLAQHACPGDYEIAVVALPPDSRYRGRGIAGHLVRACEEEVLRRHRVENRDPSSPVRMMILVAKEDTGAYWLKQGFKVLGSRKCAVGVWSALEEFTMWAMIRELLGQ